MHNLSKISFNILYTESEILLLLDYVNFKYFDIKKINEKYEIICLLEEIIKRMYMIFIGFKEVYKNFSCLQLFAVDIIKGGGKKYLFQKIIINYLESHQLEKNPIPGLKINQIITIPNLISKQNDINIPFIEKKNKIKKNKVYLIKQEIYGDKLIDFLIIDNHKQEQGIFSFQVNLLNDMIFKEDELKEILNKLIYHLQNFFTNIKVKKENLYYGYIFSLDDIKKPEFKLIYDKCKENEVTFSYYSYISNDFFSSFN